MSLRAVHLGHSFVHVDEHVREEELLHESSLTEPDVDRPDLVLVCHNLVDELPGDVDWEVVGQAVRPPEVVVVDVVEARLEVLDDVKELHVLDELGHLAIPCPWSSDASSEQCDAVVAEDREVDVAN